MNLSKVIVFAIFAFGLGTASYAQDECRGGALIDNFWENDVEDCISADERQDNGWGNGDQDAPGNSVDNNNAENYQGSTADNPNGAVGGGGDGTEGNTVTNSSGNTPPGQNK